MYPMGYYGYMDTKIRNIPDDLWKDFKKLALDADSSINAMMIELITAAVKKYRETEKRKIVEKYDELKQGKLESEE